MPKNSVPVTAEDLRRVRLPLPPAPGYHVVQAVANAFGRTYLGVALHPDGCATAGSAVLYSCRLTTNGVTDWREHWQMPLSSRHVREGGRTRLIALEFGFTALLSGPDRKVLLAAFIDQATSRLLVSRDGESFDIEANPPPRISERVPFRHLALTSSEIFASPASGPRSVGVKLYRMRLDSSRGPSDWDALPPPLEGGGRYIGCLTGASGCLYVGVTCPTRGFELWSYEQSNSKEPKWQKLLDLGALRYSANAALTAIAPDGEGGLWLGTGGGENGPVGHEGAEILHLNAEGQWQLAVGEARFSPKGLVLPTSCCGPGVDDHAFTHVRAIHIERSSLWATFTRAEATGEPIQGSRVVACSAKDGKINQISSIDLKDASKGTSAESRGFIDSEVGALAFGSHFEDAGGSASTPALWRLDLASS